MHDEFVGDDPLQSVIAALREPVAVEPGLRQRAAGRATRQRRAGVARIAVLALLVLSAVAIVHRPASGTSAVTFTLRAPAGSTVALVGDFTDWRSDRLHLSPSGSGVWQATIRLRPGRYRFAYLVDHRQWRADTVAPTAPDDFGRPTSLLTVNP
ncbi:MAG TPA: isoamylase early set domain-containing protein [Gemmatimonadales bacterium]|jgi:hypothetical protein